MLLSKFIGKKIKEVPKDSQSISHQFLIRGAYIRPISSGIYSLLPLAQKIIKKIEFIIREEMDKIDGQEILMPIVLPAALWEKSGRYDYIDECLLKFKDRNNKKMLLAMTHEEAVCELVKTELFSYKQIPFMLYQIQTKYRDEARPRAGLIRVREFTMKDAYSFHKDQNCLNEYYKKVLDAYKVIFKRIGMKDLLVIDSDTGMMGGEKAHEFMAVSDIGEDSIFASPNREYLANKEIAVSKLMIPKEKLKKLKLSSTPQTKTISQLCQFLNIGKNKIGKALFFESQDLGEKLIFIMIRADIEVNEIKIKNALKITDLKIASEDKIRSLGIIPGYASPIGISREQGFILLVDPSFAQSYNLVVGANKENFHYENFNFNRDCSLEARTIDLALVKKGDICRKTGEKLQELKGIEVGNTFQLGTKYSDKMDCRYLDENGKERTPQMGCYGIGLGRSMAAVIEQSHDQYGPIWPLSIAPFHLHIIPLNYNKDLIQRIAQEFYKFFNENQIETLLDDRNTKAGFAFNDADLMGVPFRIIISPQLIEKKEIEFSSRCKKLKKFLPIKKAKEEILSIIKNKL